MSLENRSRETWLHGWSRSKADVLIGTGVYCVGCGKDYGVTTVAIPEWWEHWVDRRPYPDWPFDELSCPVCYLFDLYLKCRDNRESEYIQVGKDGIPIRDLRGRLPK